MVLSSAAFVAVSGPAFAGPNEGDLFAAVNAARASAGLPAYSYAGDLASVARAQAERMAASGELYHNPSLASDVSGWSRIGENVAYAGDWRSAHQVMMNSAPHRAAILDSGYTQMGVGTAVSKDGTFWVSEVFRTPLNSGSSSSPSSGGNSGSSTTTPSTSTGSSSSTSTSTPTTPIPVPTVVAAPSPREILAEKIKDARQKIADRRAHRRGNDPIVSALDFSAVMETVAR